MAEDIDYDVLARMLEAAADKVRAAKDELSTLDAATGDGDHGAAMCKVAGAISTTIAGRTDRDIAGFLSDIGWAAMGTDAGSTGPLYGSLFVGMGTAATGLERLDTAALARLLEDGVANLRLNTKAKPGDKTMIDALVPACEAVRVAVEAGDTLPAALAAGAEAAVAGAEATKQMKAAFGRARHIGDRSIGHADPGAVSMSLVLTGLKEGYTNA